MVTLLIPTMAETQSRRDWYENNHANESYTSKTRSACGRKVYKCKGCNVVIDRDVNGAWGIFLHVLLDGAICRNW